jgi:hypothetical protein
MLARSLCYIPPRSAKGASYSDGKGGRQRSPVLGSLERHSLSLCAAGESLARHESGLEGNSASGARGSSGRFLGKIGRQLGEHGSGYSEIGCSLLWSQVVEAVIGCWGSCFKLTRPSTGGLCEAG